MKKFLTVVGLLAVLATPAFAESLGYDDNNVMSLANQTTTSGPQSTVHVRGDNAFAMAPGSTDPNSPALTGGANVGYNQAEQLSTLNR
jgi:hypothetical protein